jgi:hypothetical protein
MYPVCTQEVSYNSVLLERRKQLHERIGAALETLYANSIDDHLDALAHHYGRSGNASKAFDYYERAGRQAVQRSAYTDAMRGLTAALELLMRLPESSDRDRRELNLQTTLGPVLMITKGWAAPETERTYVRARALAETGGTPAQRVSLLAGLFGSAYVGGRFPEARDWLEEVRSLTTRHPEPEFLLELYHFDWSLASSTGELEVSQRHLDDGLAFYEAHPRSMPVTPISAHHPAVCGYAWGALVLWLRGYPESARRHTDQGISLAHQIGHSPSVIFALCHKAHFHHLAREVHVASGNGRGRIVRRREGRLPSLRLLGEDR